MPSGGPPSVPAVVHGRSATAMPAPPKGEAEPNPRSADTDPRVCLVEGCDQPASGKVKVYCARHLDQRLQAQQNRREWLR